MRFGQAVLSRLKILSKAILSVFLAWIVFHPGGVHADPPVRGQKVFLPVYSELPYGDRGAILNFRILLDVRNLDARQSLSLRRVDYLDENGARVRSFIEGPRLLAPFASEIFQVKESDRSGGPSSGFLIEWSSNVPIQPPVIQGLMVHGAYNQGIAFKTEARVIETLP